MAVPSLRVPLVVAAAVTLVTVSGCGREAPPQPPVLRVAEETRDLKAIQEGMTVTLRFTPPQRTTAGGPLPDLEEIEVWRAEIPEAQEPQGSSERDRQVKLQLLEARGERLRVLPAGGLAEMVEDGAIVLRDEVVIPPESESETAPAVLWYAVRSRCCRRRLSAFSNIVRVTPRIPPEAPESLELQPSVDGITLQWPGTEGMVLIERSADGTAWQTLTDQPVVGPQYLDPGAAQEQSWSYRLRAVTILEGGQRVLGDPGPEETVDHPDVYPPPAPAEVVCLPEGVVVRLRWQAVEEAVKYRVARSQDGGPWHTLAQPRGALGFEDPEPPLGALVYSVKAVDAAGNESEATTCSVVTGRSG